MIPHLAFTHCPFLMLKWDTRMSPGDRPLASPLGSQRGVGDLGLAQDALGARTLGLDGWHSKRLTQGKRVDFARRPLPNSVRKVAQPIQCERVALRHHLGLV